MDELIFTWWRSGRLMNFLGVLSAALAI